MKINNFIATGSNLRDFSAMGKKGMANRWGKSAARPHRIAVETLIEVEKCDSLDKHSKSFESIIIALVIGLFLLAII